jgi:hypothetical protein
LTTSATPLDAAGMRRYAGGVTLPASIPVRYTEEEAEFISVRPVVRQKFRVEQLVDMVLSVTGKDSARVAQILRSGTLVYNFYRYWWERFEPAAEDLDEILRKFPDPDPSRLFGAEACIAVEMESGGERPRALGEIRREEAERRGLFTNRSFWDGLMDAAREQPPMYQTYSYARRADLYVLPLSVDAAAGLARSAARIAPRGLRGRLRSLEQTARLVYVCPR